MNGGDFRRVARKPWRRLKVKTPFSDGSDVVVLD